MKKLLMALVLILCATTVAAQDATAEQKPCFGYLSYTAALQAMPEYAAAMDSVARFQAACDTEMARVEREFNVKYEAFLDGQKDFPRTILLKRQQELQQMLEQNVAFRQQLQQEVKKTEAALLAPIREKLQQQLSEIGASHELMFILNTDADQLPWLNTQQGINVMPLLAQ
jgi:outer membrane protein